MLRLVTNFLRPLLAALIGIKLLGCVTSVGIDEKLKIIRDLNYSERSGVRLKADWHPALNGELQRAGRVPACVVIHGGGWYKGNKKDMESVAARLADAGIAAFNVSYRLAPEHRFPAAVHDIKDAIRWVKGNAASLGVDADRVCLIGYSAGAHLALMAGFTQPDDGLDDTNPPAAKIFKFQGPEQLLSLPTSLSVKAIAAGGAPIDLTGGNYNEYYEKFFGQPPNVIPQIYIAASPITYVRKGLPPVFLYHGKHDWVVDVDQSRRLVAKLRSRGVEVEYLEVTLGHVATFLFDDKEVGAAIKFLSSRL